MKARQLFCFIVIFTLMGSLSAQPLVKTNVQNQVDTYIENVMQTYEIPGLAIGLVKEGQIFYTKGYGVKSLDNQEPITDECLFHMASVSKPFIATAIMQLVEAGKIDLDAPIVNYLPYFKLHDPRYNVISVRQMLTHTSGMPDIQNYEWENPQYDDGALTRYVLSLNETDLLHGPGEKWVFSSMAYDVLGNMIAKVSRMTFEDYMKKYVLTPLEMKRSTFYKGKANKVLCTAPHIRKLEPMVSEIYPYNRAHAPSSTLHANVKEMCNYALANLNRGMFGDDRLLKAISFNTMWSPVCNATEGKKMGLSWFVCEREGELVVTHSGGDIGFQANFCLIPKRMAAVIVLSNYDLTPAADISIGLWDIMVGKEPSLPKTPVMIPLGRSLVKGDANLMIQLYDEMQSSQSDLYIFNETQLDILGKDLLGLIRIEEAIEVFKLNIRLYPGSSKVYDSLGGAFMIAGDNQLAIENYEKSLELDPANDNAKIMIKKIRDDISGDI